jgi:hypothetical protein
VLRINQKNYEEAFVDDPVTILILEHNIRKKEGPWAVLRLGIIRHP